MSDTDIPKTYADASKVIHLTHDDLEELVVALIGGFLPLQRALIERLGKDAPGMEDVLDATKKSAEHIIAVIDRVMEREGG